MRIKNCFGLLFLLVLLCFLAACDLITPISLDSSPTTSGTSAPPNTSPATRDGWTEAALGVELRTEDWKNTAGEEDTVTIVRFDLHHVHLGVAYQPTQPLYMSQWMQQEHATAIINGGYFDVQDRATALVVSKGHSFGMSYVGFGGMLSVDTHGRVRLRSLQSSPYDPSTEQLQEAVQSSPMLVLGGKRAPFSANAASAPRSVVAMDKQGHLLFIVSPGRILSLDELAEALLSSDLSIDIALNLDGGSSTSLYVNAGNEHVSIESLNLLPLVIIAK